MLAGRVLPGTMYPIRSSRGKEERPQTAQNFHGGLSRESGDYPLQLELIPGKQLVQN